MRDKRCFVMFLDDHHGDGRLALWCAAPEGMQHALVAGDPEAYFVPPYVGHRGWIGVRLDRELPWDEIAGAIEDAWLSVAPKRLAERFESAGSAQRPRPPGICVDSVRTSDWRPGLVGPAAPPLA